MDRVDATTAADVAYRMRHAARGRSARNLGAAAAPSHGGGTMRSASSLASIGSLGSLADIHGSTEAVTSYVDAWAASRRRWAALRAYGRGDHPAAAAAATLTSSHASDSSVGATCDGGSPLQKQTPPPPSSAAAPLTPAAHPPLDVGGFDGRRSDQSDVSASNAAAARSAAGGGGTGWWPRHFVEPSCAPSYGRRGGHFGFGLGLRLPQRDSKEPASSSSEGGGSDIDPAERMRILEKILGHMGHQAGADGGGHDRAGPLVLDPLSPRRMVWDLVMCVVILYSAVEIPFSSSFLWAPPLPLRVLDVLIDALLLLDVVLCFFTGYVDADDKKTMNQYRVARHYFFGWFVFDLVSALPFDAIARSLLAPEERIRTSAYQNVDAFRIVNVLKLLRLVRLQKLVRYLFRWNDDLGLASSHSLFTQTACIVFAIFLFVHTVGCIEFLVPMLSSFPSDSWPLMLAEQNVTQSCAILIDAFRHAGRNHTVVGADGLAVTLPRPFDPDVDGFEPHVLSARWDCYSHAFFQSLSQMLCIGFGLVNPKRTEELWVTIFSMGLGAAMYAMSLSFVVNVISTVDYPSRSYKNHLEELNEYMRVRCLPPALRTRLRNYFVTLYPNRRIFDEGPLVSRFSRSLTLEIHTARCEALFAAMPLFSDKDEHGNDAEPALLSAICSMLRPEMAFPAEWLTEQGHAGSGRVCFIERGVVEVLVDDVSTAQMGDGTYIGEIAALGDQLGLGSEAGFATASVRALEYCHLHVIAQDDFRWLAKTFSTAFGLPMRNIAKLRLDRARPAQRLGASVDERSSTLSGRGSVAGEESSGNGSGQRRSTAALANAMTDDDVQQFMSQQRKAQSMAMLLKAGADDEPGLAEESSHTGADKVVAAARAFKRILIDRSSDRRSVEADATQSSSDAASSHGGSACGSSTPGSRQASRRAAPGSRWLPRTGSSLGEAARSRMKFGGTSFAGLDAMARSDGTEGSAQVGEGATAGGGAPSSAGASNPSQSDDGAKATMKRRPTVTFRDCAARDNV